MSNTKIPKVLSLFSGAGGLDIGFEQAGFETVGCLESDFYARETLKLNRPGWPLLSPSDVTLWESGRISKALGLAVGELDLLLAGPPCQPFSKASYWSNGKAKSMADPRAATLMKTLDFVEELLPRAVVIENVPAFAYRKQNEGLRLIRSSLRKINKKHGTNYSSTLTVINAVHYGVPQRRERAFIVVYRDGKRFRSPVTTNSASASSKKAPLISAFDAFDGLEVGDAERRDLALGGKWADLLPSIPEGRNYLYHTPEGEGVPLFGWRTRYWSFLLKLSRELPSWTLPASPGPATGPFHWENRHLSVREMCRLQTFPDSWNIVGSYREARKQIGNAVPSAMAEAVARRVWSDLLRLPYDSSLSLALNPTSA